MNPVTASAVPIAPVPQAPAPPIIPPQIMTTPNPALIGSSTPPPPTVPNSNWSNSFKKVFDNPVPVVFGLLATTALLYAIYYYRYNIQMNKVFVKSVEDKLDEIQMKHAEIENVINTIKQNQNQNQNAQPNLWES